jgi:hypothetical protein
LFKRFSGPKTSPHEPEKRPSWDTKELANDNHSLNMSESHLHDFPSLFSLKGKVAVVTGGSRGLGLHAASA